MEIRSVRDVFAEANQKSLTATRKVGKAVLCYPIWTFRPGTQEVRRDALVSCYEALKSNPFINPLNFIS